MFASVSFNGEEPQQFLDEDGYLNVEFDWDSARVQYRCKNCDEVFPEEEAAEGYQCLKAQYAVHTGEDNDCEFPHDLAEEDEPLSWVNSAGIHIDEAADQVDVHISVGDPRGGFVMRMYRTEEGKVRMEVPHPEQGLLHEPLREINPRGVYEVGR